MTVLVIILVLALVSCTVKICATRKQLKEATRQLEMIMAGKSQTAIKVQTISKSDAALVQVLNEFVKHCDETQAQYQRLMHQNKLMTASISHDFRTPLTSMLGYVQMLKETTDQVKTSRYLDIVEQRIQLLTTQVEDFYTMSILESDEFPWQIEKLNPRVLLMNQVAMFYEELHQTFAEVEVIVSDEPLIIRSSANALNRILGNLIRNAFLHGTGKLMITEENLLGRHAFLLKNQVPAGDYIEVERIFERTYRKEGARVGTSTGLGLAIAKQLAEELGGSLTAAREDGWLVFRFEFKIYE